MEGTNKDRPLHRPVRKKNGVFLCLFLCCLVRFAIFQLARIHSLMLQATTATTNASPPARWATLCPFRMSCGVGSLTPGIVFPRQYSPLFSNRTPIIPAMAPIGQPALGDEHWRRSFQAVCIPPWKLHPSTPFAATQSSRAVSRAGIKLMRSSNRAEAFPKYSYRPPR